MRNRSWKVMGLVALCLTGGMRAVGAVELARELAWDTPERLGRCTRDAAVAVTDDGRVRLRKSVLLQDEQGQTHYKNRETLSAEVWGKKQFFIHDPRCDGARLFVYTGAARVTCNGTALPAGKVLPSTGWHYWDVPPELLKQGLNEFVFSGGGSLVIEQSLYPNRSAKSTDGGRTWEFDRLGFGGVENGEYLVRLRLAQYPREGVITSEVVDLADDGDGIRPRAGVRAGTLAADGETPGGTAVTLELRTGPTPVPDASWSAWSVKTDGPWQRFVQWRARLTSENATRSPELRRVSIRATLEAMEPPAGPAVRVLELTPADWVERSQPFAYQPPGGRVELLRRQYKLDEVVAEGKTELERFVLLREWARFSAPKGWDAGSARWVPPWDALVLLETNKKPIALCMCTHYSTIFTQCALALGYNARQVILDHHCVAEVWSNQFQKWILMDTGNSGDPTLNCHFEKDGVPLSALELRRLWKAGREAEIDVVYTPPRGRIKGDQLKDKNQCGLANFRRFAIPFRNNHLVTPFPGELEHGEASYYADVYLWWEDGPVPVESPEYGNTSCRPGDFYWTLNKTAIVLQETDAPDALDVALWTVTPNFRHFIVSVDGGEWRQRPASFTWKFHEGENTLRVKSVNGFGAEGSESVARVRFGD